MLLISEYNTTGDQIQVFFFNARRVTELENFKQSHDLTAKHCRYLLRAAAGLGQETAVIHYVFMSVPLLHSYLPPPTLLDILLYFYSNLLATLLL